MTAPELNQRFEAMYGDFADADVRPLWREEGLLPKTPRTISPHVWRWEVLRRLAEEAGRLVPVDKGGDRRVLALSHPDLHGKPFATPTLWAAIQYLNAGETAPAHRHSPGALRFVIEGSGVFSIVNGDPLLMEPGDLILTPSFNWHAHDNQSDQPMIWFDGLDLPMIQSLDAVFFEEGADVLETYEPLSTSQSEVTFTGPGLRADLNVKADLAPSKHSPLLAYRWKTTDASLDLLLKRSKSLTGTIRYTDPTTGGDIMPTLRAEICRLLASGRTPPQRMVGSSVILVIRGRGNSVVGDRDINWRRGDIFVVPSWCAVEHRADEDSDLFVLSDSPVIERIGLGRSEQL